MNSTKCSSRSTRQHHAQLTKFKELWQRPSLQAFSLAILLLVLVWPFGCISGI